jgi:hypothetical protein
MTLPTVAFVIAFAPLPSRLASARSGKSRAFAPILVACIPRREFFPAGSDLDCIIQWKSHHAFLNFHNSSSSIFICLKPGVSTFDTSS